MLITLTISTKDITLGLFYLFITFFILKLVYCSLETHFEWNGIYSSTGNYNFIDNELQVEKIIKTIIKKVKTWIK